MAKITEYQTSKGSFTASRVYAGIDRDDWQKEIYQACRFQD